MNLASYALRHRAVMLVLVLAITAGGTLSYGSLGRLEDPEFTIKEALITTSYPGATAEQVEREITEPIEIAVQSLKQLKEVRSVSRAGLSIVTAEIKETYDKDSLPQVWDELRRKIAAAAPSLPPGSGSPDVNDDFGDVYGVFFALTGDGYGLRELKETAEDLRRELLRCRDVGRIDFWGLPEEAVFVDIDRTKLARLGIAPAAVFSAIEGHNAIAESGRADAGAEAIRFRVGGDFPDATGIAEHLLATGTGGGMIRLGDVAKVERGILEPRGQIMRWNGAPAVGIGISTVAGGNVIAMGDDISARLHALRGRLPFGMQLHAVTHQGETVKTATRGFVLNLAASVAIVVLVLVVFMGLRQGGIMGAVLLLTILATFICMRILDITLQRISLGALIVALGMLVDNAIVVTEGMTIKVQRGLSPADAAAETVRETQWPLLAATVIAILAFAAISLSQDMTGEWLKSLFQVILLSLGLSWVLAVTVTPYLCAALPPKPSQGGAGVHSGRFYRFYRCLVSRCIARRGITLGCVVLLLGAALWGFGFVRQDFMPDMNRPQITLDVRLPEGSRIEATDAEAEAIAAYARTLPGVTDVAGFSGAGPLRFLLTYAPEMTDESYGQLLIGLDDFHRIPEVRAALDAFLDARSGPAVTSIDAFKLGPGGGAVEARLSGPDPAVLRRLAERVEAEMRRNPNIRSLRTDWGDPVKVQTVRFAESRARETGLTRADVSQALATTFPGRTVGHFRTGDDLLPIVLRPLAAQRSGPENLGDVLVWSAARHLWVPIGQVIDGQETAWEIPAIRRIDRMRVLSVICKQKTGTTDGLFRQLRPPIEALPLPAGYALEWGGEHKEQVAANAKLMGNVPTAFAAMFLVSVMLFDSLRHALIVFACLPLAVIGVSGGMLLADKPFGFMAMLGFLSLSGMLIKNEIVLLDEIDAGIAAGKPPRDAVLDAAVSRVRPVAMAALTTILGMAPLLQDAFFAPMAVTVMGGLSFATGLTLVVVPVMYCVFFHVPEKP